MSAELYSIMALALITITALLTIIFLMRSEHERILTSVIMSQGQREIEWREERHQLIDRIQAPSFNELKHAEVKTIKAQQGIKDPLPLEPL